MTTNQYQTWANALDHCQQKRVFLNTEVNPVWLDGRLSCGFANLIFSMREATYRIPMEDIKKLTIQANHFPYGNPPPPFITIKLKP